ncbi:MAG: acetylornithine deacetylase [Alphaproteobacteria bacterium]|jgi:acetylornithine deacetylase|nr:acetylornithine deacetylase [Alphaproteobacteria bacterium]
MTSAPPILDMVQRLIAFDTVSRNSNLDLIAFAQDALEHAGAKTRLTYDTAKTKANVFGSLGPRQDGGYVLSGHTDVVPVDGQDWSGNPFAADIREGRLYGRGAADMKGFIGVALALLPEFAALDLKRPLHFAFSFDEEVGCVGVRRLLEDLNTARIRPALAVIGEPTEMRVVGAHKAGAVIETLVRGREGHSSAPSRGANAVMMAGEFIASLAALGSELMTDRDEYFEPPFTTIQANMVSGGTAVNVLARDARVMWEYRALPDRDTDAIVARALMHAETAILPRYRAGAPEAQFETRVKAAYPGLARDVNSPAVRLACALSGSNDVHAVSYGTEAGLFQGAGIPAVICGPGSIAQAHKADEFVALEQLDACAAFLRRVAHNATE